MKRKREKKILQKISKLMQIFQITSRKVSLQEEETKTTFNFLKDNSKNYPGKSESQEISFFLNYIPKLFKSSHNLTQEKFIFTKDFQKNKKKII